MLDAAGWPVRKGRRSAAFRTEEEETAHGPADYALWLDERVVGIAEAKKLTIGPQNVLTQAERYARGLAGSGFDFDYQDALVRHGGWGAARRAFGPERLEDLLIRLNEAMAA